MLLDVRVWFVTLLLPQIRIAAVQTPTVTVSGNTWDTYKLIDKTDHSWNSRDKRTWAMLHYEPKVVVKSVYAVMSYWDSDRFSVTIGDTKQTGSGVPPGHKCNGPSKPKKDKLQKYDCSQYTSPVSYVILHQDRNWRILGFREIIVETTECSTTAGDSCLFPFEFDGITYSECIPLDGVPQCATQLAFRWRQVKMGPCLEQCPVLEAAPGFRGCTERFDESSQHYLTSPAWDPYQETALMTFEACVEICRGEGGDIAFYNSGSKKCRCTTDSYNYGSKRFTTSHCEDWKNFHGYAVSVFPISPSCADLMFNRQILLPFKYFIEVDETKVKLYCHKSKWSDDPMDLSLAMLPAVLGDKGSIRKIGSIKIMSYDGNELAKTDEYHGEDLYDIFKYPRENGWKLKTGYVRLFMGWNDLLWCRGLYFPPETFTDLELEMQIALAYDSQMTSFNDLSNIPWINPDGSDPSTPMRLSITKADLDENGMFFFKNTQDNLFGFVAEHIKLSGASVENFHMDFVGFLFDKNQALNKRDHDWISNQPHNSIFVKDEAGEDIDGTADQAAADCASKCPANNPSSLYYGLARLADNKYNCICMGLDLSRLLGIGYNKPLENVIPPTASGRYYALYRNWDPFCGFEDNITELVDQSERSGGYLEITQYLYPTGINFKKAFLPGTTLGYRCSSGFGLENGTNPVQGLSCRANRNVVGNLQKCFVLKCPEKEISSSMETIGDVGRNYGDSFTVVCKPGFVFLQPLQGSLQEYKTNKTVECVYSQAEDLTAWKIDGVREDLGNCIGFCTEALPSTPTLASISSLNNMKNDTVGQIVTYSCPQGFEFEVTRLDDKEVVLTPEISIPCAENDAGGGFWNFTYTNPAECQRIQCQRPDSLVLHDRLTHNISDGVKVFYQDLIKFECNDRRFHLGINNSDDHVPALEAECLANKTYSINLSQLVCVPKFCDNPTHDPNRTSNYNFQWDGELVPVAGNLTYECQDNAKLQNNTILKMNASSYSVVYCGPDGEFQYPDPWPECAVNVTCGSPPDIPEGGSQSWISDKDPEYMYKSNLNYTCAPGKKFDTNGDSMGNAAYLKLFCGWNKAWHYWSELPPCIISHCIDPFPIPGDSNLEEVNTTWTPVNKTKEYRCKDRDAEGRHTKFFESDRNLTSFSMTCLPDGNYDFVNERSSWPTCLATVHCGPPPDPAPGGSRLWIKGTDLNDTYGSKVRYHCVNGSQFDTDSDGAGDTPFIDTECLWSKLWSPWTELPPCLITHCVDPFQIPEDTDLEEVSSSWTKINTKKMYRCRDRIDGHHTKFFKYNRGKSDFGMFCLPDGSFDFVNERKHWPTCLEDIECALLPPMVPTSEEYMKSEDDGNVVVHALEYPSQNSINNIFTSDVNNTDIPRNYMANLTYSCGSARKFKDENGVHHDIHRLTCLWDRNWTASTLLHDCDWVECLRPPVPPPWTKLRLTDWDGQPVQFGGQATYVCERGYQFEEDPYQESVVYTCQDGSKRGTNRGFFNVPKFNDWSACVQAPMCPRPPEIPLDGSVVNKPSMIPAEAGQVCQVDGGVVELSCPTFLSIYITSGYYGRRKADNKLLCTGEKDNVGINTDQCHDVQVVDGFRNYCKSQSNCSIPVSPTIKEWEEPPCNLKQKNQLLIHYVCVKCRDWSNLAVGEDCVTRALVLNEWEPENQLTEISLPDQKGILISHLNNRLNGSHHTTLDLSLRSAEGETGSLCSLGMMHLALTDTLNSVSEMRAFSYEALRNSLVNQIALAGGEDPADFDVEKSDLEVLAEFKTAVCGELTSPEPEVDVRHAALEDQTVGSSESREEMELRSYGSNLKYSCGLARMFEAAETGQLYDSLQISCNWNKTWTPTDELDACVWVACINPPKPPEDTRLVSQWNGNPVEFNQTSSYVCEDDLYLDIDRDLPSWNITCLPGGGWDQPDVWPRCIKSVNCSEPPSRPATGTWEWDGSLEFRSTVTYTCGPYGLFSTAEDDLQKEIVSECLWNRTWSPSILDPCKATSCQVIPTPPRYTRLLLHQGSDSSIQLHSEETQFNPRLPVSLPFPGPDLCDMSQRLLIVGTMLQTIQTVTEVILGTEDGDEALHILIDLEEDLVGRWSVVNGEERQREGEPGDGTSIDPGEPFMMKLMCDEDGWVVVVNEEPAYPHYMHQVPLANISHVKVLGDVSISFIGFGDKDMSSAPSTSFNLTYVCPEGMVFSTDWFAIPFLLLTCQENGEFDEPEDWSLFSCVLPTTPECYDCTTTTTTTTTTDVPTTMPPDEMLYPKSADYHWDRFDKNVSRRDIVGGWTMKGGFGQGPFGFGSAVKFSEGQCMYDKDWMKADEENGLANDPCMINPLNCTEGISFNIWEKMSFDGNIITAGGVAKKYLMSTGGDFNSVNGKAWPGFAIYHQGVDIVGMVSTGDRVWALSVSGQLYNNTWTQIGLRFVLPNLANPRLATQGVRGLEKMGGLEMFINMEKVGHSVLPEATDRGSTQWKPQPRLSDDGTETGQPLIMFGCHQNADMKLKDEFTGFAGTEDSPALIDEAAIWRHRLPNLELDFFYGGFSPEFENINADQFGAMLGGVDLADPEQAAAAQAVLEAMLLGPPTTLPPFPTRTPKPTTKLPTTLSEEELAAITTTTTAKPVETGATLRKGILSKQNIMTSMLGTSAAREGQDPEYVEGRFSMAVVASALLTGDEENVKKWRAVEEEPEHEGPQKTVRELEEYMLAWVGSVNISADREDEHNWRTSYFDPESDSMRYATKAKDMVMNVDKIPLQPIRDNEQIRLSYPDYDGWEWAEAKAQWNNVRDNFTVPTGMFEKIEGCKEKPVTILTAVYNGLTYISPMRRNPVNIRSHKTKLDSKVISVRAKLNADPIEGDVTKVYQCRPDPEYMKWNPVRLTFWHNEAAKAKRTLLWHSEEYWEGLEVRHCVWWNERLGFNGAWDDHGCTLTKTDDAKTDCECSNFGSYAVLAELLEAPEDASLEQWLLILKWIGIIIGTCLLTVFIATVFLSVVVGEMFHQIRMWCCLSYMIANIFMLLSDTGLCDGRHSNLAFSMALMFFYQAALVWNMCETHATFKGVTSGLINGRTSVYHPISWGAPLFCLGFITFLEGDVMGTHPNCFISWEKNPIKIYFAFNLVCFAFTILFSVIVAFNLMRVQSHNKDTVMYLKDQVKGMFATSLCMIILWSYGTVGYFAYMKTKDMEVVNLMPAFQVLNGWFGVIMFFLLGIWSKRFRIGLSSQAEEKKNRLNAMKQKYEEGRNDDAPSTAETSPISTRPSSAAGSPLASSRPASSQSNRPASSQSNRPASSMSQTASRPASSTSKAPSRPATSVSKGPSRPSTSTSKGPSRPGSGVNDESME